MKRALLSMFVRRRKTERVRLESSDSAEPAGDEVSSAVVDEPNVAHHTSPRVRDTASEQAEVAELQIEIEELKQLLEARTQAWLQARDQLSKVRFQISEVPQHPSARRRIEPLADRDWDRLQGDSPTE